MSDAFEDRPTLELGPTSEALLATARERLRAALEVLGVQSEREISDSAVRRAGVLTTDAREMIRDLNARRIARGEALKS